MPFDPNMWRGQGLPGAPAPPTGPSPFVSPHTFHRRVVDTLLVESETGDVVRFEDPAREHADVLCGLILTVFSPDKGAVYVKLSAAAVERLVEFHKEQLANDAAYALETK